MVLLLFVQLVMTTWFVMMRPMVYDEWYSWLYYVSRGVPTIFFDYSAPNNHVLYNLAARLALLTDIAPEVAVRIPSLIAGLLTTWIFYRLCRRYFGEWLTLILVLLLTCNFCFTAAASSARGYAFVNLFCVLLLFSVEKGEKQYSPRARVGIVLAQALGLYTIPSFLYVMIVPVLFLFLRFSLQRRVKDLALFCADQLITVLLTTLAYSGILFSGQRERLLHPGRWAYPVTFEEGWPGIALNYLRDLSIEIFGVPYWVVLATALIVIVLAAFRGHRPDFMILLCASMLLLPPLILLAHQVYPFPRSLYFLAIPGIFVAGALVHLTLPSFVVPHDAEHRWSRALVWVLPAIALSWLYFAQQRHAEKFIWEGPVDKLRQGVLKGKMKNVDTVAYSGADLAWLPAQLLVFANAIERGEPSTHMATLDSVRAQDLIVIESGTSHKFDSQLQGYKLLLDTNGILIYCSEKLLKQP